MTKPIVWKTVKIQLGKLREWEKNPVKISKREMAELAKSLDKFDHVIPYVAASPIVGGFADLLDGHQRKMVELQVNKISPKTMVDVRVPDRKLTEKERQEIVVRLRKNTGEFDFEKLELNFDVSDLLEWGFEKEELGVEETPDFQPVGIDEQGRLDQKKPVTCPDCGCEFTPK